eukprot:gi/632989911/ref/XP_007883900.1/ PREDICTED: histone H1-II-like [Callorhinchus milii]
METPVAEEASEDFETVGVDVTQGPSGQAPSGLGSGFEEQPPVAGLPEPGESHEPGHEMPDSEEKEEEDGSKSASPKAVPHAAGEDGRGDSGRAENKPKTSPSAKASKPRPLASATPKRPSGAPAPSNKAFAPKKPSSTPAATALRENVEKGAEPRSRLKSPASHVPRATAKTPPKPTHAQKVAPGSPDVKRATGKLYECHFVLLCATGTQCAASQGNEELEHIQE